MRVFKGLPLTEIPYVTGNLLHCELQKLIDRILVLENTPCLYKYVDNNSLITATGLGVTVTKTADYIQVNVPKDVDLLSVSINGILADTDDSGNLYVRVVNTSETIISQDLLSIDLPGVTYAITTTPIDYNSGDVSELYQVPFDNTKNVALVYVDSGEIHIKIESVVDDHFIVKLSF